jgi:hypothetical protein
MTILRSPVRTVNFPTAFHGWTGGERDADSRMRKNNHRLCPSSSPPPVAPPRPSSFPTPANRLPAPPAAGALRDALLHRLALAASSAGPPPPDRPTKLPLSPANPCTPSPKFYCDPPPPPPRRAAASATLARVCPSSDSMRRRKGKGERRGSGKRWAGSCERLKK